MIAICMLLLSSCVGPGIGYVQSPRWLLKDIDSGEVNQKAFYVAFTSNDPSEPRQLHVTLFSQQEEMVAKYPDLSFHMTEDYLNHTSGGGDNASIKTIAEADGTQLTQVFVVGDTPWSSLSEYRVIDDTIYPLRHAHASPWLLLGVIIGPMVVSLISKPLRRKIDDFFAGTGKTLN